MPRQGPERAFTDKLLRALRQLPHSEWTKIGAGPWQVPGLPDILGCVCGVYVAIEVKDAKRQKEPKGGLTDNQRQFLERVSAAFGVAVVVYSNVDPEKVAQRVMMEVVKSGRVRLQMP